MMNRSIARSLISVQVPLRRGTVVEIEAGPEAFSQQLASVQLEIMGMAKFRTLQERRLDLVDLVGIKRSRRQGKAL